MVELEKTLENIGNDGWTNFLAKIINSDFFVHFEPFLGPFNQLILGKITLTINVCTDYCNSGKQSEIAVINGYL